MNKSIIIIGAGQGVGLETARYFGKKGFNIGLMSRSKDKLEELKIELENDGLQVTNEIIDANAPDSVSNAVHNLIEKMGGIIDVFLYNVPGPLGAASYVPVTELSNDLLQNYLNTRVLSANVAVKAATPFLLKSNGSILITSGQSDRNAYPYTSAMGISQAALRMLATHLHQELSEKNVHVAYIPLDNPPMYSDFSKESQRSDLPADFHLETRVEATNVAKVLYELSLKRDTFEQRISSTFNVKK